MREQLEMLTLETEMILTKCLLGLKSTRAYVRQAKDGKLEIVTIIIMAFKWYYKRRMIWENVKRIHLAQDWEQ
jgi:hypothetical protein